MNRFSYYEATSVEEALKQVNTTVSKTIQPGPHDNTSVLKAGGIDLLDLMKEGLSQPARLVSIRNIEGLDQITFSEKEGLRIGANVTLAGIASNQRIKTGYLALHQAASHAATPQVRNMATLGGNLAQRTRCWYFRSKHHQCFRKGSSTCFARIGENQYHAIMGNTDCASVHSSSLSTALMAFNAAIEITGKDGKVKIVSINEFFVSPHVDPARENILGPDEIITAVLLGPMKNNIKSHYIKMGERDSHDWPLADVAVVLEMNNDRCKKAKVVLGAAAPVPIHATGAEKVIQGQVIDEETAVAAGKAAMKTATPLSQNAHKVPIFETIIKRAIEGAAREG